MGSSNKPTGSSVYQTEPEPMMQETIIKQFAQQLNEQWPEWEQRLEADGDLGSVEETVLEVVSTFYGQLIKHLIETWQSSPGRREQLRQLGGRLGRRLKEDRQVRLQVGLGACIQVRTPYFIKPPRGEGRGRGKGRGAYLGLEVLGIRGRCTPRWLDEVVELALLCPSLAVARQVLARRGVEMDIKRLRRLCQELGWWGLQQRSRAAIGELPQEAGLRLVIAVDGGRLRQRCPKRGRKRRDQKRQGYRGEWREPRQVVLYLMDAQGEVVESFPPLYDATLSDHEGVFWLLDNYLKALEWENLQEVVFCADGAGWIWKGVEKLCRRRGLAAERVHQVLDHTHAKQNLQELIDLLPARLRDEGQVAQQWRQWLWNGQVEDLEQDLKRHLRGRKRQQGLRKFASYFAANASRMQYARFREQGLPCGSGTVESAIRRVINLRLKGPGIFWKREMAECFLFLRSQLLSGRWEIFLSNVTGSKAQLLAQCQAANEACFAPREEASNAA